MAARDFANTKRREQDETVLNRGIEFSVLKERLATHRTVQDSSDRPAILRLDIDHKLNRSAENMGDDGLCISNLAGNGAGSRSSGGRVA
jgi:hypothetical protein